MKIARIRKALLQAKGMATRSCPRQQDDFHFISSILQPKWQGIVQIPSLGKDNRHLRNVRTSFLGSLISHLLKNQYPIGQILRTQSVPLVAGMVQSEYFLPSGV